MGSSENSDFFVRARKYRAHDCMDAGDRATQDAKAVNRNTLGSFLLLQKLRSHHPWRSFEHGTDAAIAKKVHFVRCP